MKRTTRLFAVSAVAALLAVPGLAEAESEKARAADTSVHAADSSAYHDDDAHHVYPNHIALFGAGLTSNLGHSSNSYTLGFDYERRFGAFGLGGVVESVFAHHRETIVAGLASVHPWQGLKLYAGAGQLSEDGHGYFLKRFGTAYDFHFGRFSVTPGVAMDLVHGEELLVYGVSVGLGF